MQCFKAWKKHMVSWKWQRHRDPQPEVDKTALQAKVDECSKLNEKDYTEASWEGFAKAFEEANAVLKNENATQDDVDQALKVLNEMCGALKKVTTPTTPTTPTTLRSQTTPTEPDKNNQTTRNR